LRVRLSAQVQKVEGQWLYDSAPLRVGTSIRLQTPRYEVGAIVTKVPPPD
jgi:hypothetical protein